MQKEKFKKLLNTLIGDSDKEETSQKTEEDHENNQFQDINTEPEPKGLKEVTESLQQTHISKEMSNEEEIPRGSLPYKKPSTFNGDKGKVNLYLQECELMFTFFPNITEEQKITVALSYMTREEVLAWREYFLEQQSYALTKTKSWATFINVVKKEFHPSERQEEALLALETMKQTDFDSIEAFAGAFKREAEYSKESDPTLILRLKKAFRPSIVYKIIASADPPTTYKGWLATGTRLQNNYEHTN